MTSNYDSNLKNDRFLTTEGCWVNVMLQKGRKTELYSSKIFKICHGSMSGPIGGEGPSAINSSHLCACFQREMMKFVDENDLEACFPYLDNVTICGKNQENRDANMEHFLEAAKRKKLCYNTGKCIFSTRRLPILRYIIEEGTIRPDSDRLRPQLELPFYTTRSP